MQDHTLFSIIYKTSDPVTGCQPKKVSKIYIQTFCVWVSSWALVCANWPSKQDIRLSFVWVSWAIFCRVLSNSSHESESCWISLFKEEAEFFSSSTFLFCISSAYKFSQWLIFLNISTIKKLWWFLKKTQLDDQFKCKKLVPALNCQSEIAFGPALSLVFLPGLQVAVKISALGKGGSISTHHQKDLGHYLWLFMCKIYIKVYTIQMVLLEPKFDKVCFKLMFSDELFVPVNLKNIFH